MRIVWRKFLISVLILFCVSIRFFSSANIVPASHETDVLYNYLDAPTFHTLFLNFTVKKRLFKWPVKVTGLYSIIIKRLLGSGDIEMNPRSTVNFKKFSQEFLKAPKNTKFFHANCQSIVQKKEQIQIILNGLGDNTVYGLSETWLKESNDQKLWELNKDRFKTFRSDGKLGNKTKGGGVYMLIIPKTLNPKSRNDLNCMNKNQFESLRVECNFNNDPTNKNRQLINISYNPSKSLIDPFLEELSTSIDIAIVENKPITLMGDFNIYFFNHKERQCLETITIPYGFHILNTTEPTRIGPTSKSLVDYIISDLPMIEGAVTYVLDTPLRTLKKTEVDHRATSAITNIKMKPQARVTIKEIFDKRNYRPEVLRNHLSDSDWSNFYNQNCAEGMFSAFTDIFENALRKCVQKRKVFISNDKN